MKKTSLFCLALGLSAALCACGSAATETTPVPETDSAVAATESNDTTGTENAAAETESVVTEDAVPTSYLTGLECTEEEREQRPMAAGRLRPARPARALLLPVAVVPQDRHHVLRRVRSQSPGEEVRRHQRVAGLRGAEVFDDVAVQVAAGAQVVAAGAAIPPAVQLRHQRHAAAGADRLQLLQVVQAAVVPFVVACHPDEHGPAPVRHGVAPVRATYHARRARL